MELSVRDLRDGRVQLAGFVARDDDVLRVAPEQRADHLGPRGRIEDEGVLRRGEFTREREGSILDCGVAPVALLRGDDPCLSACFLVVGPDK